MSQKKRNYYDPTMSDTTILMKVDDLINMAMGPPEKNTVNFKMLETVLFVLARQMRMLGQQVEVQIAEMPASSDTDGDARQRAARAKQAAAAATTKKDKEIGVYRTEKDDKNRRFAAKATDADAAVDKGRYKSGRGGTDAYAEAADDQYGAGGSRKRRGRDDDDDDDDGAASARRRRKGEGGGGGADDDDDGRAGGRRGGRGGGGGGAGAGAGGGKRAARAAAAQDSDDDDAYGAGAGGGKGKGRGGASGRARADKDTGKGGKKGGQGAERRVSTAMMTDERRETSKERLRDLVSRAASTPATRRNVTRLGSIEVVTQSQFNLLEQAVTELRYSVMNASRPGLPSNEELREEIVSGSGSLTDTLRTMQLAARVTAMEKAILRLTEMLGQLAAEGQLPADVARAAVMLQQQVTVISTETRTQVETEQAGAGEGGAAQSGPAAAAGATAMAAIAKARAARAGKDKKTVSGVSSQTTVDDGGFPCVTPEELDEALGILWESLSKMMNDMTARANSSADAAVASTKGVAQKLEVAMSLDYRITTLRGIVNEYSASLAGFDSGVSSQLQSFQEQMVVLRGDLASGLEQLERVNNSAESAAITELQERHAGLVNELELTLHSHRQLTNYQNYLTNELQNLVECVEMMREQKADRDEVADGLRDKADSARLSGLVKEEDFAFECQQLHAKIEHCNDKFHKQDEAWMNVVSDFDAMVADKADMMMLLSVKDQAQREMRDLQAKLQTLTDLIGDPKAAVLIRKLAKDGSCGTCGVQALMTPVALPSGPRRMPAALPPLAPQFLQHSCTRELQVQAAADEINAARMPLEKAHLCRRWTGGSHTLVGGPPGLGSVRREPALGLLHAPPELRYIGVGCDGRSYKMSRLLVPCNECNQDEEETELAAGDTRRAGNYTVNVLETGDAKPMKGPDDKVKSTGDRKAVSVLHSRSAMAEALQNELLEAAPELRPLAHGRACQEPRAASHSR